MSPDEDPLSLLTICLKELCLNSNPASALKKVTLNQLRKIDEQALPPTTRGTFEDLKQRIRNCLRKTTAVRTGGNGSARRTNIELPPSLVEDLIQFYGTLHTHKAPIVDKQWFLEQCESNRPDRPQTEKR